MEPAEFVVTMLIANLAAIPMQDSGIPLLSGLVPILTVLGVQLILAVASMRFISLRKRIVESCAPLSDGVQADIRFQCRSDPPADLPILSFLDPFATTI